VLRCIQAPDAEGIFQAKKGPEIIFINVVIDAETFKFFRQDQQEAASCSPHEQQLLVVELGVVRDCRWYPPLGLTGISTNAHRIPEITRCRDAGSGAAIGLPGGFHLRVGVLERVHAYGSGGVALSHAWECCYAGGS
jgi:hypothetical protein